MTYSGQADVVDLTRRIRRPNGGGAVIHHVRPSHRFSQYVRIAYVAGLDFDTGIAQFLCCRSHAHQGAHRHTLTAQSIDDVATDEPGRSCHQRHHHNPSDRPLCTVDSAGSGHWNILFKFDGCYTNSGLSSRRGDRPALAGW